eukprot:jgi/Astpho2/687/e_gw1.00013.132.1_t
MTEKLAPSERHQYIHSNRIIYEWDQTLQELNIYVQVPQGCRGRDLAVNIQAKHLSIALKGNPPYLDKDLQKRVNASECYWTLEDGTLSIQLCKAEQGEPWPAAFVGHEVDPLTQQEEQRRLMLERFQQEHPGFDFSGAEFSGEAPNPRTFMGGIS